MRWDVLHWVWPVSGDSGTRYERVALLLPGGQAASAGPEARNHPGVGSSPKNVGATAGPAGSTTGTSVVAPQ